jgi:hypothetical protein
METLSTQARESVDFPVDEIRIGNRHRRDLGDIATLAASIEELGLLHAIGITPTGELIFGRRRLEAYKQLGRETIPVRIFDLDATGRLLAEHDENTVRKDFTPTEAVAIGRAIEERLRPAAEQRMKSGTGADGKAGGRGRKKEAKPCANLAQGFEDLGKTSERAALAAGMSRATYEKAKAVVEAAEADPQKFGDLPQQMDETENVERTYRELKSRKEVRSSGDLRNGLEKSLPKRRPPAYERLTEKVRIVLEDSALSYDRGQVEELALLDPLVQEPIARMLVSHEALSVGAAKVLILVELFLRPAEALRRALPGLGETALGELHKLYDELELVTANGSSNSDGQAGANRVASSPAEVKSVEVSTPAPEKTEEKATATYFVCGYLRGDWDTCFWGLESEEAAVAWLRQNYATTCQGMDEFYIICDDSKVMAALHATVKDGEWTFAPAELQPADWGW